MAEPPDRFDIVFDGKPFACRVRSAAFCVRRDLRDDDDTFKLDVMIAADPIDSTTYDDGEAFTYTYHPSFYLESLVLPGTRISDGDFRSLGGLDTTFAQPSDGTGGFFYDLEAPGCLYFNHHQQVDVMSLRLAYAGQGRFTAFISAQVEMDTTCEIVASGPFTALLLGCGAFPEGGGTVLPPLDPAAVEAAGLRGSRWVTLPGIPPHALEAFGRLLRAEDFEFSTAVDSTDMAAQVTATPREQRLDDAGGGPG